MSDAANRSTVLLAITGSIAAYKSAEIARRLMRAGLAVQALMTPRARKFVGEATLLGLTGRPVPYRIFDGRAGERHVDLWRDARALLIAPASADVLARIAQGRTDDLVSATASCRRGPLVLAPAMHPLMWTNPAVQRNVERLREDGATLLGPVQGEVASGDVGWGRMMEPEDVVTGFLAVLDAAALAARPRDLAGLTVLVSAGPTYEDLDDVRFLGNRSSGKMGFAVAAAARDRGARVVLVSGPVSLPPPSGCELVSVRSALELQAALAARVPEADLLVMAAAVADFRPAARATGKVSKGRMDRAIALVENPDIVRGLAEHRSGARPVLVAFALESGTDEEVIARAREKLVKKGVDLVVANHARDGFEGEDNRAAILDAEGTTSFERSSKLELAHRLLDRARARLTTPLPGAP